MPKLQTACAECDLLLTLPELEEGQRADCPRCGCLISELPRDAIHRALACAIAAFILLVVSLLYPFLSFGSKGLEAVMTLPQAALTIFDEGNILLAATIFVLIIGAPFALLAAIFGLTVPMLLGLKVAWLREVGRAVFVLSEWSMVEVFIIGVIVSLVKIAKLATVVIGLSFWSYILFTVFLIAALAQLDRWQIWQKIEEQSA
jgi:paraquat-inducible protein A